MPSYGAWIGALSRINAFNAQNRLRTANRAGTAATYLYDPLVRRQAKVVNVVTTSFLSDGDEEVEEYRAPVLCCGAMFRGLVPASPARWLR